MSNTVSRETIIFFLPLDVGALTNDQSPYSATKADEETGASPEGVSWAKRQLYINPQSFQIREQKIIKKDLTKGGYLVQYWGEELPTVEVQGTTGSAGIEGINILRDIYRHEQIVFRTVLENRQRELAEAALAAAEDAAASLKERSGTGWLIADAFLGGAGSGVSDTISGLSNAVDIITDPFGGTSVGTNYAGTGTFSTVPTLAAFATNIDMYYQGEFFRGYFTVFSVTESANEPGHFNYSFSFVVTRRTGERTNFMPWHREPTSYDGETVMSQATTVSKGLEGSDMLSFPRDPPLPVTQDAVPASEEDEEEETDAPSDNENANNVGVSRRDASNNAS